MRQFLSRFKYYTAMVLFLVTSTIMTAGPAFALDPVNPGRVGNPDVGNNPVTLCHATPVDTAAQGWQLITIDADGSTGDVQLAGHANEHDADIIPAFTYSNGTTTFVGKNLTTMFGAYTGLQILNNGCVMPTATLTPTTPTTPTITIQPTCNVNEVVTPPTITGVVWSLSTASSLSVGQSVTYTATPADGYVFTAGAVTSYTLTNNFDGDCEVPLPATPTTPTITTQPSCDINEVVTPPTIVGVVWSPSGATTLAVGHSVTYTATPAEGYTFTANAVTSYTFTNNFDGDCEVPPVDVCANIPGDQSTVPKNYAQENGNCYKKVYVCKYVGTPGVDETLKIGNDGLVDVSVNAIGEDSVVVGSYFKDAQGRSFVLAFDEGQDEPDASACPASTTPLAPTVVVTPSACVLPIGVNGTVVYTVTNPNTITVVYTVSLGVVGSQTVTVPAGASRSVTFNNLAAGTYTASVTGDNDTSTTATQTVVSTCQVGGFGGGGGGQVLGVSTVAAPVTTAAVLGTLTDTGTSTVVPTILAIVMSFTAAGVMFGSRKFRNKIATFSNPSV